MHVHRYQTTVEWEGTTIAGYDAYDRGHVGRADAVPTALSLTADSAFLGNPTSLNPEQLVVLAASSCQLLSFLAIAARARLDVVGYADEAVGEMPDPPTVRDRERSHGGPAGGAAPVRMSIERIHLRPRIRLRGAGNIERVQRLVELAHRECFIANSLRTEMTIDATITFVEDRR